MKKKIFLIFYSFVFSCKDKSNKLQYLNMDLANVVIIKTKNKEIVFNKSIDPDDLPLSQYLD